MVQRRKFSKEFKLESVNMVLGRGVSIAQVARDLGVNQNLISRWIREFRQGEQQAFPGHGLQKPDDAEVTRLRREVARLKMERDILKKAAVSSTGQCNTIYVTIIGGGVWQGREDRVYLINKS